MIELLKNGVIISKWTDDDGKEHRDIIVRLSLYSNNDKKLLKAIHKTVEEFYKNSHNS